jgi:hypothetical protein
MSEGFGYEFRAIRVLTRMLGPAVEFYTDCLGLKASS